MFCTYLEFVDQVVTVMCELFSQMFNQHLLPTILKFSSFVCACYIYYQLMQERQNQNQILQIRRIAEAIEKAADGDQSDFCSSLVIFLNRLLVKDQKSLNSIQLRRFTAYFYRLTVDFSQVNQAGQTAVRVALIILAKYKIFEKFGQQDREEDDEVVFSLGKWVVKLVKKLMEFDQYKLVFEVMRYLILEELQPIQIQNLVNSIKQQAYFNSFQLEDADEEQSLKQKSIQISLLGVQMPDDIIREISINIYQKLFYNLSTLSTKEDILYLFQNHYSINNNKEKESDQFQILFLQKSLTSEQFKAIFIKIRKSVFNHQNKQKLLRKMIKKAKDPIILFSVQLQFTRFDELFLEILMNELKDKYSFQQLTHWLLDTDTVKNKGILHFLLERKAEVPKACLELIYKDKLKYKHSIIIGLWLAKYHSCQMREKIIKTYYQSKQNLTLEVKKILLSVITYLLCQNEEQQLYYNLVNHAKSRNFSEEFSLNYLPNNTMTYNEIQNQEMQILKKIIFQQKYNNMEDQILYKLKKHLNMIRNEKVKREKNINNKNNHEILRLIEDELKNRNSIAILLGLIELNKRNTFIQNCDESNFKIIMNIYEHYSNFPKQLYKLNGREGNQSQGYFFYLLFQFNLYYQTQICGKLNPTISRILCSTNDIKSELIGVIEDEIIIQKQVFIQIWDLIIQLLQSNPDRLNQYSSKFERSQEHRLWLVYQIISSYIDSNIQDQSVIIYFLDQIQPTYEFLSYFQTLYRASQSSKQFKFILLIPPLMKQHFSYMISFLNKLLSSHLQISEQSSQSNIVYDDIIIVIKSGIYQHFQDLSSYTDLIALFKKLDFTMKDDEQIQKILTIHDFQPFLNYRGTNREWLNKVISYLELLQYFIVERQISLSPVAIQQQLKILAVILEKYYAIKTHLSEQVQQKILQMILTVCKNGLPLQSIQDLKVKYDKDEHKIRKLSTLLFEFEVPRINLPMYFQCLQCSLIICGICRYRFHQWHDSNYIGAEKYACEHYHFPEDENNQKNINDISQPIRSAEKSQSYIHVSSLFPINYRRADIPIKSNQQAKQNIKKRSKKQSKKNKLNQNKIEIISDSDNSMNFDSIGPDNPNLIQPSFIVPDIPQQLEYFPVRMQKIYKLLQDNFQNEYTGRQNRLTGKVLSSTMPGLKISLNCYGLNLKCSLQMTRLGTNQKYPAFRSILGSNSYFYGLVNESQEMIMIFRQNLSEIIFNNINMPWKQHNLDAQSVKKMKINIGSPIIQLQFNKSNRYILAAIGQINFNIIWFDGENNIVCQKQWDGKDENEIIKFLWLQNTNNSFAVLKGLNIYIGDATHENQYQIKINHTAISENIIKDFDIYSTAKKSIVFALDQKGQPLIAHYKKTAKSPITFEKIKLQIQINDAHNLFIVNNYLIITSTHSIYQISVSPKIKMVRQFSFMKVLAQRKIKDGTSYFLSHHKLITSSKDIVSFACIFRPTQLTEQIAGLFAVVDIEGPRMTLHFPCEFESINYFQIFESQKDDYSILMIDKSLNLFCIRWQGSRSQNVGITLTQIYGSHFAIQQLKLFQKMTYFSSNRCLNFKDYPEAIFRYQITNQQIHIRCRHFKWEVLTGILLIVKPQDNCEGLIQLSVFGEKTIFVIRKSRQIHIPFTLKNSLNIFVLQNNLKISFECTEATIQEVKVYTASFAYPAYRSAYLKLLRYLFTTARNDYNHINQYLRSQNQLNIQIVQNVELSKNVTESKYCLEEEILSLTKIQVIRIVIKSLPQLSIPAILKFVEDRIFPICRQNSCLNISCLKLVREVCARERKTRVIGDPYEFRTVMDIYELQQRLYLWYNQTKIFNFAKVVNLLSEILLQRLPNFYLIISTYPRLMADIVEYCKDQISIIAIQQSNDRIQFINISLKRVVFLLTEYYQILKNAQSSMVEEKQQQVKRPELIILKILFDIFSNVQKYCKSFMVNCFRDIQKLYLCPRQPQQLSSAVNIFRMSQLQHDFSLQNSSYLQRSRLDGSRSQQQKKEGEQERLMNESLNYSYEQGRVFDGERIGNLRNRLQANLIENNSRINMVYYQFSFNMIISLFEQDNLLTFENGYIYAQLFYYFLKIIDQRLSTARDDQYIQKFFHLVIHRLNSIRHSILYAVLGYFFRLKYSKINGVNKIESVAQTKLFSQFYRLIKLHKINLRRLFLEFKIEQIYKKRGLLELFQGPMLTINNNLYSIQFLSNLYISCSDKQQSIDVNDFRNRIFTIYSDYGLKCVGNIIAYEGWLKDYSKFTIFMGLKMIKKGDIKNGISKLQKIKRENKLIVEKYLKTNKDSIKTLELGLQSLDQSKVQLLDFINIYYD